VGWSGWFSYVLSQTTHTTSAVLVIRPPVSKVVMVVPDPPAKRRKVEATGGSRESRACPENSRTIGPAAEIWALASSWRGSTDKGSQQGSLISAEAGLAP
jgi:hypothetical protein